MAVELRTLRVSAEMDASKYAAGAKAVESSSATAGKAVGGLGASVQQTDTKISQSGDVLARLSRQYVDGYAAAQRMQQAVNSLSRGIDSGKISMAQAEPILEGIYRKYGQLGSGASFAARGQTELAAAIDRTTARMQAQSAASSRLPMNANDNEATFRRRNLNYQLFDVTQGLALGMNPGMIAMQQGPQILQMYAGQGGVNAALKDASSLVTGLATKFWPVAIAAAAGSVAILQLQSDIEKATGKAASFGDVTGAAMKLIADDIYQYIKPAVEAISPWFDAVWESIKAGTKEATNLFIAGWMVQIDALKTAVAAVPDAFIAAGEAAANGFLQAIQAMVREALVSINDLISDINGIMRQSGINLQVPFAPAPMSFSTGTVDIGGKAASDRLNSIWEDFKTRAAKTFTTDFVGGYFQSLVDRISKDMKDAGLLPDGSPGRPIPIPQFRGVDDVPTPTPAFGTPVGWGAPQWQTDLRGDIKGFFSDFTAGLRRGDDIGEAFGKAILNGMNRALDRMLDKTINSLLDSIFGTGFQDGRGGGLLDGIIGRGAGIPSNDNIAGGLGAAGQSVLLGGAGRPNIGATGDIAAYIRQAAQLRGIDPDIALRVAKSEGGLKDPFRQGESLINYGTKANPLMLREESYGPFQLHMRNGGVGARALKAGIDPRTNWQGGVDFGLDEAANKGWGQWFGAAKAGIGNREGLEGARALGQFTQATKAATEATQGFDTGITGALKAVTGGADGKSGLGGLFGLGLSNIGSGFNPTRTGFMDMLGGGSGAAASSGGGGGILGMLLSFLPKLFGFAGGTENAPDGWAWVGEQGPELKKLRAGDVIRSNMRSRGMMVADNVNAADRGSNRMAKPELHVHVYGGSGDNHIRMLAKQGAQEAISGYDQGMRQGGFGDMQSQYSRQKG